MVLIDFGSAGFHLEDESDEEWQSGILSVDDSRWIRQLLSKIGGYEGATVYYTV